MSVAICSWSSNVSFPLEKKQQEALGSLLMSVPTGVDDVAAVIKKYDEEVVERPPAAGQFDIWTSIQAAQIKAKESRVDDHEPPYVHPSTKHSSSSLMSQKSLEICTESLGSETGSDNYFSSSDDDDYDYSVLFSSAHCSPMKQVVVAQQQQQQQQEHEDRLGSVDHEYAAGAKRKEHAATASVNYHCSIGRRSPNRSFPPPLPSISRRDGPCVQMRPHRKDGRLVVEAVAVPSQNYLHAERQGGRLLLSFINNATVPKRNNAGANTQDQLAKEEEEEEEEEEEDQEVEEEEEEEEEVEVVDRGTVVEVKVSTQPQKQSGGSAAMKVHRSSIVINKFVSCTPSSGHDKENVDQNVVNSSCRSTTSTLRRSTTSTTTAAAAAVAASSLGTFPAVDDGGDNVPCSDNKLLSSREELLTDMKRCSQLRKPLFIWETCCIATSS